MKKSTLSLFAAVLIAAFVSSQTFAAIQSKVIEYKDGDVVLEGYMVWDDENHGDNAAKPGVLIVHEWWGHNDYARKRAEQMAKIGYVTFALDMYGKGVKADNAGDAGKLAMPFYQNRALMRSRATAGLNVLKNSKMVDSKRIAAIGYCFGGTTAIELARSGADLAGIVSFHGGLDFPDAADTKQIKGSVLICTGADDPMVAVEQVNKFAQQLKDANIDYQIHSYGGAVHAFTNPAADSHNIPGVKYNEKADKRSFTAMKDFFTDILSKK